MRAGTELGRLSFERRVQESTAIREGTALACEDGQNGFFILIVGECGKSLASDEGDLLKRHSHAGARGATIRRDLIDVAARFARHGRDTQCMLGSADGIGELMLHLGEAAVHDVDRSLHLWLCDD